MNNVSNLLDGTRPLMQFATAYQTMSIAAGEVFFRRSLMLATGSAGAPDVLGMVVEKTATFADAAGEAMAALMNGKDAVAVATAALEPYGTRTAANVRELRR
jgi:hypothetical protein